MKAALHHELVTAGSASPEAWVLVTHGVFGSGGNWRSIARKLVERRPRWGAVLVDLRGHGRSSTGDPPHTLAAAAADLRALDQKLYGEGRAVRAAMGHSLGGKVVLALRRQTAHRSTEIDRPTDVLQTWVLDATPSARPPETSEGSSTRVLEMLEQLPPRFARREDFVDAVVGVGHTAALAQWLALSLEPEPEAGGFRLRLDLEIARALLTDYHAQDLWGAVEDAAMPGELHLVAAGRSTSVPHADRERLLVHQQKTGLSYLHLVADAGHWLHIDAPDAVVELLAGALPEL